MFENLLFILIGIFTVLWFLHLVAAVIRKGRPVNVAFTALCFFIIAYLAFEIGRFNAEETGQYVLFTKLSITALSLIYISLAWFIFYYIEDRFHWAVIGITIVFSASFIANLFSANSILYEQVIQLKEFRLAWGETIMLPESTVNGWHFLIDISTIMLASYLLYAAILYYRKGRRRSALTWGIFLVLVALAAVHDYLVAVGIIRSVYLLGLALSFLVIVTSTNMIINLIRKTVEYSQQKTRQDKFEMAMDRLDLIVVSLNRMGNVDYVNPYFLEITGYEADEVIGKDWFDHFLPNNISYEVQGAFLEVLKNDFHSYYENPILTRDGEERMFAWYNVRLVDSEGKINGSFSVGVDISKFYKG